MTSTTSIITSPVLYSRWVSPLETQYSSVMLQEIPNDRIASIILLKNNIFRLELLLTYYYSQGWNITAKYNVSIFGSSFAQLHTFSIIYKREFTLTAKDLINYIIDFWFNHPLLFNLISSSIIKDLKSLPIHRKSSANSKDFYFFDDEYQAMQIALLPFVKYSSAMARLISDFALWRHARISAEDFCLWEMESHSPMRMNVRYMEQKYFVLNRNIRLHVLLKNDPLRISIDSNGNRLMNKSQTVAVIVQFRRNLPFDFINGCENDDECKRDARIVVDNKETVEHFLLNKLLPYLLNGKIIDKYRAWFRNCFHDHECTIAFYPKFRQKILKYFLESYSIKNVTENRINTLYLVEYLNIGMKLLITHVLNCGSFLQLMILPKFHLPLDMAVEHWPFSENMLQMDLCSNLGMNGNIDGILPKKKRKKCRARFQPRKKTAEKRNYSRRPKKQKMQKYHRIRS